jgi:hypothetical protein
MTVRVTPLAQSAFINNVEADVYVAPVTTIIDACKSAAVLAGTVTLRIVQSGGASGNQHIQGWKQFAVNETYTWPELAGQVLATGDKITAVCNTASAVTLRLSGRQVT